MDISSTQLLSDHHLLAALLGGCTDIQANAFLAKYYNIYVMYINTSTRCNAWRPRGCFNRTSALLVSAMDRSAYIKVKRVYKYFDPTASK